MSDVYTPDVFVFVKRERVIKYLTKMYIIN